MNIAKWSGSNVPEPKRIFRRWRDKLHTFKPIHGNCTTMKSGYTDINSAVIYLLIVLVTYLSIQAFIVVIHEFIHSTTAFLMGDMQSPFAIVWGNPITLSGWDEGVAYSHLFAAGQGTDAAIIAVMPLIFHAIIVSCGLYLLLSRAMLERKWVFHLIFWLVIINLGELIAYMPFRAFFLHGDIGNINHGLGLSPWVLFFPGTILILAWLYYLYRYVLPRTNVVVAKSSRLIRYEILIISAFALFLWSSGLRMVLLYYTGDPQWMLGLIGFAAFGVTIWLCRPEMPWVIAAEETVTDMIKAKD